MHHVSFIGMQGIRYDDAMIREGVTPSLAWANDFCLGAPTATEQEGDERKHLMIHGRCEKLLGKDNAGFRPELEVQMRSLWQVSGWK